jgi:hypothetical protein
MTLIRALDNLIREKVELDHFYPHIMACASA